LAIEETAREVSEASGQDVPRLFLPRHPGAKKSLWHGMVIRNNGVEFVTPSIGEPSISGTVPDIDTVSALLANAITILRNAPGWQDVLAFNEFSLQIVVKKPVLWLKRDDKNWTDGDDIRLTEWLQRKRVHVTPP
jgi:hypothetical protein